MEYFRVKFIRPDKMSILVPYAPDFSLGLVPQLLSDEQGITYDGLDLMFYSLNDITERLQHRLMLLSQFPDEITTRKQRQVISDAWMMIDCVHRVGEFLSLANVRVDADEADLLANIKLIRNSYQHANDRISEHFIPKGGSVFGDLTWYYHPNLNRGCVFSGEITQHILKSGISFKKVFFETGDATKMVFTDIISSVEMRYPVKPKLNKPDTLVIIVNLDKAATLVNRAIARIDEAVRESLDRFHAYQAQNPDITVRGLPPANIVVAHPYNHQ